MRTDLLQAARKKAGYTQEELAILLGYSGKSGYSFLENGKVKITVEASRKIAEALSLSDEEYKEIFLD